MQQSYSPGERVVGLIINPGSRRTGKRLDRILEVAHAGAGIHYHVTRHEAEAAKALSDLAAKGVNVLAICGGDGTISRVLTPLLERRPFDTLPLIALLPGGTANMIARDIGLRGPVDVALRHLRNWADEDLGEPVFVRRPVLRVSQGEEQAAHCGMFFGAGAIVQGIEYTNENIHSRGLKHELSLGLGLVRTMWGIARQDPRFIQLASMSIGLDDEPSGPPHDIVMLFASTLERLFLNIRPYWGTETDRPLRATIIRSPAKRLIRTLPALLRGKPNRNLTPEAGYLSHNVGRVNLHFDGPYTLDGEILHAHAGRGPVEVSEGGKLTFLTMPRR